MEFKQIKEMIDSFNMRFERLSTFEKAMAEATIMQKKALDDTNKKLRRNMEKSVESYLNMEIRTVKNEIKEKCGAYVDAGNELCSFKDISANDLVSSDFVTNRETVVRLFGEINETVAQLNALDFEKEAPLPVVSTVEDDAETFSININGEEKKYTYKASEGDFSIAAEPYAQLIERLSCKAAQCQTVLSALETMITRQFDIQRFDKHLKKSADEYMSACASALNKEFALVIKRQLQTEDDILREDNFKGIYDSGNEGKVNFEKGSLAYPTKITIGNMNINYLQNSDYKKYINEVDSPLLNKYTPDGKLTAPYVLELRKNGNIFIELCSESSSDVAIEMVQKIMLSFLMAFPPARINYQLIDIYDTGEFANFNQLNNIENNLFKKTYNDDSRVAATMVDIDERMGDVYDNKITRNGVKSIYDYNVISENDPQSFTVLSIVGFPECFVNEKTIRRLKKIIDNGNRSGFFTILVYDKTKTDQPQYIKDFVEFAKKEMNYFKINKGKVYIDGDAKNEFIIHTDGVYEELSVYTKLLKQNIKKGTNKVIPLSKMFDGTDKVIISDEYVDPAEVIDIPIGMRGGEVQTLAFSSKGDGAAHALAIGGTGSGKSNLLHTIVMSACYKYSPEDLNIYLVDFKGGVEFKYYEANRDINKQLPHIKLTALSSDPEDGLAVLANIDKELSAREALFRSNNVEDIMQYKKRTGKTLARLLVIIDEVQELFERDQSIGGYAINLMSKLFKKGRAFGINVLWASQNVPKVAGLRDKVISQVGNRISLKLNNPEDAQELGISVQKVSNLSNTLGVGVIKDTRTGANAAEFRVAYAESSDNRGLYSARIIEKWQNVVDKWASREPLFVVGSNLDEPKANDGKTMYTIEKTRKDVISKSIGDYSIAIGQDYISGKSYNIPIHLRGSNSNLWFAGANVEVLRDMMGFSLLSVLIENRTNLDFENEKGVQVYYFNGEVINQKDPDDLFFVLPNYFDDAVKVVGSSSELTEVLVRLYNLRKLRAENIQAKHTPVFIFINKLQEIATEFKDSSRLINLSEKVSDSTTVASPANVGFNLSLGLSGLGSPSGGGNKMTFSQLFNDIFENGPNQNIHIVFSIDKPSSIPSINTAMRNCQNKVFIKGLDAEAITAVASFRSNINIGVEGLGVCIINNEMNKFKPYRYYSDCDAAWLIPLVDKLNGLWNR